MSVSPYGLQWRTWTHNAGFHYTTLDDERDEEYERKFAVRWLTNLISLLHAKEVDDALLSRASGLLAICSGSSASGDYIRSFRFTLPTGSCISVDVRDGSINSSSQDVLVGVQTWGSASILAQLIVSSPGAYLPLASCEPLRVLELGAGTGLVSLAAARILENRADMPAEIIASDYDLTVMDNLRSNIARNSPYRNLLELSPVQLDWQSFLNPVNALGEDPLESRSPLPPRDTPIEHPFDVIFGADIVYEPHQAYWIKATVSALLKRPSAPCVSNELGEIASDSRFHLVIPLRETHESESASVLTTFPLLKRGKCGNRWSSLNDNETCEVLAPPPLALTLATIRMEGLEPKDRGRPMGYLRYEIGWAYL